VDRSWDVIAVGGGLGGAALAKVMAERGARVLVVEKTREFRDRVRGEALVPWGCEEAERLGLLEHLRPLSNPLRWWDFLVRGQRVFRRDIAEASGSGNCLLSFYHPRMQQTVLDAARGAGAEIRRGAAVRTIQPGVAPEVEMDGGERLTARLIVIADGRGSMLRRKAGFEPKRDRERRLFGGVYLENVDASVDVLHTALDLQRARVSYIFPQGHGRVRAYVGEHVQNGERRLQGVGHVGPFIAAAHSIGFPEALYREAKAAGPLATFDATDEWVAHPYKQGVALLGDAAATSDPTWGQGMALTLRDARVLADALAADSDWDRAGHEYASAHDAYHSIVHRCDNWYTDLLLELGPEADARRARALPHVLADPERLHDTPIGGPDRYPADEAARQRFFALDVL
jgi:2-polyprenyl-6-methoxyphenol hydroxylase-like FAD-dependent oxidoreductase